MNLRSASTKDLERVTELLSRDGASIPGSLEAAMAGNLCFLAEFERQILGLGGLSYDFFDRGFVKFLYVGSGFRRRGVASALLSALETKCTTPVIFTSTNESNLPMQNLLTKCGYQASGVVRGLDPGDPELFFRKHLRP
jgi:ribosomal protein S18 acetylase RimI-like enzyme